MIDDLTLEARKHALAQAQQAELHESDGPADASKIVERAKKYADFLTDGG